MRFSVVRMGVLMLDVIVRVFPMRMRVSRVAVTVLVGMHSVGHDSMLA